MTSLILFWISFYIYVNIYGLIIQGSIIKAYIFSFKISISYIEYIG